MTHPTKKILLKSTFILFSFFLISFSTFSQKKPLDHDVYDSWKSLKNIAITDDGKYAVAIISEQEGDDCLWIRNLDNKYYEWYFPRAYQYKIFPDNNYIAYKIKAPFAVTRQEKIKKTAEEKMSKDSLIIFGWKNRSVTTIPAVKDFKIGEDFAEHIVYTIDDSIKSKEKTNTLVIREIRTAKEDTIRNVLNYTISKNGKTLAVTTKPENKDTLNVASVYFIDLPTNKCYVASEGLREYKVPTLSEDGEKMAFLATNDSTDIITKKYAVYYFDLQSDSAKVIADNNHKDLYADWHISENNNPTFSPDGKRLFFGTAPIPLEKDTTIPDFERAQLDIWHWQEPLNQPMQLINLDKEKKKNYLAYINLNKPEDFIQLGNETIPTIEISQENNGRYAIGISNLPYRYETQWDVTNIGRYDIYVFDLNTNNHKLIKEGLKCKYKLSYEGNYLAWYDENDRNYHSYNMQTGDENCLTCSLNVNFWNEENDMPIAPDPYGATLFFENDNGILVYDQYDIWRLDLSGQKAPENITKGYGRDNKVRLRYIHPDDENKFIKENEPLLLSAFNTETKERGYFRIDKKNKLEKLVLNGYSYNNTHKAKNTDAYLFTKGNFSTPTDLYVTKNNFKTQQKLTEINPQAREYSWGTAELVKWNTYNGKTSEGLLFKPENFDASKKYPMMTYFYERSSDNLYSHFVPQPSWSTVNISFYVSRGYIVFIPDIRYTVGQPGQDAYDYVISGVEELCKNSWIDKDNLGVQGQSWGGYQIAYLITKTNIFKCAGAGAPVSNMFSAYNGIRWESGMARQFQYEQTQSRIGQTMWEAPKLYWENSPVFFADKVETPLLIMHNDNDGAVPWYQGIEYFLALKRLGKPVWMLQYNNEAHNLKERKNRKDLSIRLQQFFDYYLKGEPMPKWMKTGVPATEKGIDYGFEYVEE